MNTEKYAQPFTFKNGLTLKNRFLMAPMTTKMSFYDGVITADEKRYYQMRSKEVGAVVTAAANVSENGKGWEGELGVYDDKHIPGLSDLASTIKVNGTKAFLQLYHGGRMTQASILKGVQPVAPSSVKATRANSEVPRELEEDEIFEIIEEFKAATVRAVKAGFDGVELHGANTYLIQQFFSPHSNRRTDQWGGSMEKRFTFIDKLVDAVTAAASEAAEEPFIVGYRFSPEEIETPGIRFNETLYLIDQLCEKPLDYLHVSLRTFGQVSQLDAYDDKPMITYLNERIDGRIPFIAVGDIRTGEDAEQALKDSDLVALGRVLLADPNWVSKVSAGKEDMIRYNVAEEEREVLALTNGVWGFMQGMMPDRLK